MTAAGYVFDQAWTLERTDPAVTVMMPMTVAAWGWRAGDR